VGTLREMSKNVSGFRLLNQDTNPELSNSKQGLYLSDKQFRFINILKLFAINCDALATDLIHTYSIFLLINQKATCICNDYQCSEK
jgi:hypothetical protein